MGTLYLFTLALASSGPLICPSVPRPIHPFLNVCHPVWFLSLLFSSSNSRHRVLIDKITRTLPPLLLVVAQKLACEPIRLKEHHGNLQPQSYRRLYLELITFCLGLVDSICGPGSPTSLTLEAESKYTDRLPSVLAFLRLFFFVQDFSLGAFLTYLPCEVFPRVVMSPKPGFWHNTALYRHCPISQGIFRQHCSPLIPGLGVLDCSPGVYISCLRLCSTFVS